MNDFDLQNPIKRNDLPFKIIVISIYRLWVPSRRAKKLPKEKENLNMCSGSEWALPAQIQNRRVKQNHKEVEHEKGIFLENHIEIP